MSQPLEPRQRDFREAMAQMSAAVSIVTSDGPAGRCGITATAVCSVTDAPPTVLVCVNQSSACNAVFKANGRLCINVLSAEQEEAARHFAGMTGVAMGERFAHDVWGLGRGGQPLLQGALASLEGRIGELQEVGSHSVLLVELDDIRLGDEGDSLVYFARGFRRIARGCPA